MNFTEALHTLKSCSSPVTALVGASYPLLYSSFLVSYLKKKASVSVVVVNLDTIDFQDLQAQLASSFLGQSMIYWFGDITSLSVLMRKNYRELVLSYTGPHHLIFWTDSLNDFSDHKMSVIELASTIDRDDLMHLIQIFLADLDISLFHQLLPAASYEIDHALLLAQYGNVMSRSMIDEFNKKWSIFVKPAHMSLFTLSSAFFAHNQKIFYTELVKFADEYPSQFWISFWSEQIFRAANYIPFARDSRYQEAKKIAHKLPFTFIKNDWRQCTLNELYRAHDFLYVLDYTLKNGGSEVSLDLFYLKFLTKVFASSSQG